MKIRFFFFDIEISRQSDEIVVVQEMSKRRFISCLVIKTIIMLAEATFHTGFRVLVFKVSNQNFDFLMH